MLTLSSQFKVLGEKFLFSEPGHKIYNVALMKTPWGDTEEPVMAYEVADDGSGHPRIHFRRSVSFTRPGQSIHTEWATIGHVFDHQGSYATAPTLIRGTGYDYLLYNASHKFPGNQYKIYSTVARTRDYIHWEYGRPLLVPTKEAEGVCNCDPDLVEGVDKTWLVYNTGSQHGSVDNLGQWHLARGPRFEDLMKAAF